MNKNKTCYGKLYIIILSYTKILLELTKNYLRRIYQKKMDLHEIYGGKSEYVNNLVLLMYVLLVLI
jgi:hypothetical protein